MTAFTLRLERSAQLLASRLERLEARLQGDDAAVWTEYRETAAALAQVFAHVARDVGPWRAHRFGRGRMGAAPTRR
jgi:hypothetical protein